tara:strand:- start:42 stop:419 length:378 start_codon:yes stop_codon:yes gene_type:complete
MYSKKEMNFWYIKILNNHFLFPQDLIEKILLIINKENIKWEEIKKKILKNVKKNIFHNLLYFRKEPKYIYYKNNNDYYYYDIYKNDNLKTIICKKNHIILKWINPIIFWWDETDNINDWDWINEL